MTDAAIAETVVQNCRSWILRLLYEGHDKATVAETVGCNEYDVTRVMRTARAYDDGIVRALQDCRKAVGSTRSAWHSKKGSPRGE